MMLVHGDYRMINREDGNHLGSGRFAHIWMQAQGGEWRLDRDLWSTARRPLQVATTSNRFGRRISGKAIH